MSEKEKLVKFERLAENRVNEAVKKIRLIGNLSNRKNYQYTKDHVDQIFSALEQELKNSKGKFSSQSEDETKRFHFKK